MNQSAILAIMSICSRHLVGGVYDPGFEMCPLVQAEIRAQDGDDRRQAIDGLDWVDRQAIDQALRALSKRR